MTIVRLSVLSAVLSTAALAWAAEGQMAWPNFRGPNGDGISQETGLLDAWPEGGPKLAWRLAGLGKGFSSLSFNGGKFFTMGDRGEEQFILCYDLAARKQVWAAKVGPAHKDTRSPGPRCTPTLDGERAYALGSQGELVCVQMADGKELWRRNLSKDFEGQVMKVWKYSESPLIDGERLICTPGGPKAMMAALDRKTGKTVWTCAVPKIGDRGAEGSGYGSIVISNACGVKQYVTTVGRGTIGVRAEDGQFLWGYNKIANNIANIPNCVVRGDYVFCTTSYKTGSALLKLTKEGEKIVPQEVYFLTPKQFENHHGGVVLVGDHLYGGSGQNNGIFTCIEFLTGKIAWQQDPIGKKSAAVLYADGELYVRYEDATMCLVEASPAGFKLKGKFALATNNGPSWPHPVIVNKKLYIRDHDDLLVYDVAK